MCDGNVQEIQTSSETERREFQWLRINLCEDALLLSVKCFPLMIFFKNKIVQASVEGFV
jgi:hypothetical protein